MADFSFEGLLGGINNAFSGGSSNYLDEYLTPEQRRMMQRNAMLAASAALLKAGGESTRRIGIGEALGEALQAGQGGYEKAQTGALTQMALKQKMDEAKRAKALQERIAGVFAPQAATPAVDTGAPPLPTSAGAAMPPAQAAATPMNQNVAKANQYLQVAKMLEDAGQLEKAMQYQKFAMDLMQPPKTAGDPFRGKDGKTYIRTERGDPIPFNMEMAPKPVGQPQAVMKDGKPTLVQRYDDDSERILTDQQPYEAPPPLPTDIQAVQYLTGKSLAGAGQPGISQVGNYRATLAPKTTVTLPPQQGAFESGLGLGQSKKAIDSQIAAEGAATILDTNQTGRAILNSGAITGTGANFLVGFNNALKQAGIDAGYADAAANSQAYAAAMGANVGKLIKQFGAGTGLSDADREFAMQMAGGKITLTEQALRKILDINDKAANRVIDTHNRKYRGVKTNIPLTVEKPAGAAPPPPSAASQIPTGAPAANLNQQRQDANAAIAKGAPAAAVRQRFKQNTGEEL